MQLSDIYIEVRDVTLARVGLIRPEDLNMTANVLFNNVGDWTIKLPLDHPMSPALRTPGAGIIVTGPDDVLFSGPVTSSTFIASSDDPIGTLSIAGATDDIVLADALAFPDPSNADAQTQASAYDTRTGACETVMHGFVRANMGADAPAARTKDKMPFVNGDDGGNGVQVKQAARFDQIGPMLATLAATSNIGFRVVQRGNVLRFETYVTKDLSKFIRLDVYNGTLSQQQLAVMAPTGTDIIVGGKDDTSDGTSADGTDNTSTNDRAFWSVTDETAQNAVKAWGRRPEVFINQTVAPPDDGTTTTDDGSTDPDGGDTTPVDDDPDGPTGYKTVAKAALAQQGDTKVAVQLTPSSDSTMRFGHDWNVGDTIATVTDQGEFSAPVSGLVMAADSTGFHIGVTLGDTTALNPTEAANALARDTAQRVAQLERA